jgi:hypothetical protein
MIGRMAAARGLDPAGTGVVALPLFSQFLKFFNFDLHEQVATAFLKRQLLHRAPRACLPARTPARSDHTRGGWWEQEQQAVARRVGGADGIRLLELIHSL